MAKRIAYVLTGMIIAVILLASYFIKISVYESSDQKIIDSLLGIIIFHNPFILGLYVLLAAVLIWIGLKKRFRNDYKVNLSLEKMDENSGTIEIKKEKIWKYLAAIALVAIVIAAFVFLNKPKDNVTGNAINIPSGGLSIGESPVKGKADAPVTIIEFSDFECPFCGRNFRQTYPLIEKNYIDTGKVKYSFKDYPLEFHEKAQKASEAARCVREQLGDEGFWKMHDKMYNNQASLDIENYKKWARELGAQASKFDSCLTSGKFEDSVKEDLALGKSIGVRGTPAFFVNNKPIIGACPYTTFQEAIDAELSGKDWSVDERCKVNIG